MRGHRTAASRKRATQAVDGGLWPTPQIRSQGAIGGGLQDAHPERNFAPEAHGSTSSPVLGANAWKSTATHGNDMSLPDRAVPTK